MVFNNKISHIVIFYNLIIYRLIQICSHKKTIISVHIEKNAFFAPMNVIKNVLKDIEINVPSNDYV